jgi:hypothetical protein
MIAKGVSSEVVTCGVAVVFRPSGLSVVSCGLSWTLCKRDRGDGSLVVGQDDRVKLHFNFMMDALR